MVRASPAVLLAFTRRAGSRRATARLRGCQLDACGAIYGCCDSGIIRGAMNGRSAFPTVRATVFAAVCTALSLCAHVGVEHSSAPWWSVLAALVLVFGLARAAALRERSLATISTLMLVSQFGLHLLFDAAAQAADATQQGYAAGMTAAASSVHHTGPPEVSMIGGHVVGALVAAWWLRRGEAALFRLVHTLGLLAKYALRLLFPTPDGSFFSKLCGCSAHPSTESVGLTAGLLRFMLARRGPPLTGAV